MKTQFKIYSLVLFLLIINAANCFSGDWVTYKTFIDTVTAIEQKNDTFWLGSKHGLAAYDQKTGITVGYPWENNIQNNCVNGIAIDRNGVTWAATDKGIFYRSGAYMVSAGEKEFGKILAVDVEKNNNIWFISSNNVIFYDRDSWHVFTASIDFPVGSLITLVIDDTDTIWIGTKKNGIMSYNGSSWTIYDMYKPDIVCSTVDIKNRVWFGDYHGMAYSYDGNNWNSIQVVSPLWYMYSLDVDKNDIIWAGSNKGLYRSENGANTVYTEDNGLEITRCNIVKIDEIDNESVCIVGIRGLTKYNGIDFSTVFPNVGPLENNVYSIAIDHNNVKWFGHNTDNITCFEDVSWSGFKHHTISMIGEHIAVDSHNTKWLSAETGVVLSFNDSTFTEYNISAYDEAGQRMNPKYPLYVSSIVTDNDSNVWMFADGTNDYEYKANIFGYNGENIYVCSPYLYLVPVFNLAIDSKNQLWKSLHNTSPPYGYYITCPSTIIQSPFNERSILSFDHYDSIWIYSIYGIAEFDSVFWIVYNEDNSGLTSNVVYSMAFDQNNTKWIGTDAGVCRFDGETWTTFNTQNSGLCDNKVNAIAVEKNNTIWFGTDNGVSQYTGEVIITSVDENKTTPVSLPIIRSYPNPFNPSTTIEFFLPDTGFTTLIIYNIAGQKVRVIATERMTSGIHRLHWDGKDDSGSSVSAGIYFARLTCGGQVATGKMVMVK